MKTRVKMLKVKIKSLAAESRIIRREEERALDRSATPRPRFAPSGSPGGPKKPKGVGPGARADVPLYAELRDHRLRVVRAEQRHSLLAYAFLRGRSLSAAEPKAATPPDWSRVKKLVEKFGTTQYGLAKTAQAAELEAWAAGGVALAAK